MSPIDLVASRAGSASRRYRFAGAEPIWLGRDPSCEVVLEAEEVSRRHACLERVSGELEISDHSANGTLVAGAALHRARRALAGRSEIAIGPYRIEVAPSVEVAAASSPELRRRIQRELLDHLDLAKLDPRQIDRARMLPRVRAALARICAELTYELPDPAARAALIDELAEEALGLGPLEALLRDPTVSEIMVVDPNTIYVERRGLIERSSLRFTDCEAVRAVIERIITPLGRRIDESSPLCDARLPDGSRVNAIIPPLATRGPCITIRKFAPLRLGLNDLVAQGALTQEMAAFLAAAVRARKNLLVSGGTGSGKTTLLNALSAAIPERERIVTIEDAVELKLDQEHVVQLEARPPNMEGKGAYSIRDLVRNALRMRPDRILVGECRGGEAIDMLQAMNTGHAGSMTTTHANSPRDAVARIETLCLMAGLDLPIHALRQQIAQSLDLIVQQNRSSDGARRVTRISEVTRVNGNGEVELEDIFYFEPTGVDGSGRALGAFRAGGWLPSFAAELALHAFTPNGSIDD